MLLFKEKRWALQPIDWKRSRVAPLLWRCKIHNGTPAQWGGTSFTLFLCHPFKEWGEHEETAIPEEDRGTEALCEKVQPYCTVQTPADTLSAVLTLTGVTDSCSLCELFRRGYSRIISLFVWHSLLYNMTSL